MKTIRLSDKPGCKYYGKYVAIVDDCDFKWLRLYRWQVNVIRSTSEKSLIYAVRNPQPGEPPRKLQMHQQIAARFLKIRKGHEIDHIEPGQYGGLDNRRTNLRAATRSFNMANTKLRSTNRSGFKGVWWEESRQKFQAFIKCNYQREHLGRFDHAEDAARAYDVAALRHFGEFARLNFPQGS